MRMQGSIQYGAISAAVLATSVTALAQAVLQPKPDSNEKQVVLVSQDTSDCAGGDVPDDLLLAGGMLWVTQRTDGNTSVKLAMTGKPNTTYHVAVKCVRPLGDVTTDDDGVANSTFAFPTNLVDPIYSFELTPQPAGAGDKYQSAQVKFR